MIQLSRTGSCFTKSSQSSGLEEYSNLSSSCGINIQSTFMSKKGFFIQLVLYTVHSSFLYQYVTLSNVLPLMYLSLFLLM